MPYPGYLLNPGDMYQVDVDSVMYSTGAVKPHKQRSEGRGAIRRRRNENANRDKFRLMSIAKRKAKLLQDAAEGKDPRPKKIKKSQLEDARTERDTIKEELQVVVDQIQKVLQRLKNRGHWRVRSRRMVARRKRKGQTLPPRNRLLYLMRTINDTINQTFRIPIQELDQKRTDLTKKWLKFEMNVPKHAVDLERRTAIQKEQSALRAKKRMILDNLTTGISKLSLRSLPKEQRIEQRRQHKEQKKAVQNTPEFLEKKVAVIDENSAEFREALARARENPVDESKPYATPWEPRPYMSAFAFIPRYLEVNHNICSAVYLRHPVARPGLAEVPSPFPTENLQLAFNWYLRRR